MSSWIDGAGSEMTAYEKNLSNKVEIENYFL